ncbi:MAG: hypothetical protein JXO22_06695, partial [Phycisphaerae bacterium]|nr:hypothetical protein [Phycisphaerae bacterium]
RPSPGVLPMTVPLHFEPFDLDITVYTADGTFCQPLEWQATERGQRCTVLANGTNGERIDASGAFLEVRTEAVSGDRIRVSARAAHHNAVKAIKFALELPHMKMLAPEEMELVPATWRQWDYPRDWRTGFAVWQAGDRHFSVSTCDFPWHFKRMRALRTGDRMRLEIVQDANSRERSFDFETSMWEIGYRSDLGTMLDEYAAFARQAFGAADFGRRRDMPDWVRGVGLVVNMHCTDWNGEVNLDYAGMTRAAATLAELFPAERTILYPIGWDGRYMRDYPTFETSEGLGGREGFKAFCRRSRELGFHVMPHLNAMVCNMRNRLYLPHLKDYVLRNHQGRPIDCVHIDWDHDGLGDTAHSYLSLIPRALRDVLIDRIGALVADYGIDSVFLDETCNVFYNDPAWDQVDGVRRLVRDIRRAFPDLLIAGEEWNEMLLGLTPVVQIWEETADGRGGFGRAKSPLMREWAGRFVRSCGYLALASPDGTTGVHEWPDKPWIDEQQNEAYYIPTLSLTGHTIDRGMDGIRATVARANAYLERYVNG